MSVLVLAATLAAGCGRDSTLSGPNQPPALSITSGPVDTLTVPLHWLVEIAWTVSDPDGRADYFEYAVDPPTLKQAAFAQAETSWVRTRETRVWVRFRASHPDRLGPGATASEHHVFALRAVDDRGGVSPLIVRAFYARTVAPDVQFTSPSPRPYFPQAVPLPFRAEWSADDPDGEGSRQPAFHRVRLLSLREPAHEVYLLDPDSLWHDGAETGWADWSVVGGDTSSAVFTIADLSPDEPALLAVLAVDAAGATTPYLLLDRNLLQLRADVAGTVGPRIHIFSPLVDFTYASGGWSLHPFQEIAVEASSQRELEFHWSAIPAPGRRPTDSRWKLDGDPTDDVTRSGPSDLARWSERGPANGSARLPALADGTHRLYVEVRDEFGDRSLGIVRIQVSTPSFERDLLVVDDTRLEPDRFAGDPVRRATPDLYEAFWPSATELDTFLFARGGVPWRGTRNPPEGVLSPPGLLAGYRFDTLGTRLGLADPAEAVPFSTLARYRHVLWIVDGDAATSPPWPPTAPVPPTALRALSRPGFPNALASYVGAAGRLWLAGGGTTFATLFDRGRGYDYYPFTRFTVDNGGLGPGRVLYDAVHVRSAIAVGRTGEVPRRSAARRSWSGHGPDGTLSSPDYSRLAVAFRFRSPATDPLPPTRPPDRLERFYLQSPQPTMEFVTASNEVREDMDPDPDVVRLESVLDTVLEIVAPIAPPERAPVMLYYHGRENAPIVFTGFDLWSWSRADCQAVVDLVLGDIWGLARSAPGAGAPAGAATARVRTATPLRSPPAAGGPRR